MMDTVVMGLQIIIALVIFAVWIFRPSLNTNYRAGNAQNIFEEFAVYGLPKWSVYAVGATMLSLAFMLVIGIWYTHLVQFAVMAMGILMAGALVCHLKTRGDPLSRATPASLMLAMCALVLYFG
jgi:hypothetical protein